MNKRLIDIFLEVTAIEATSGDEGKVAEYITSFLKNLGFKPYEEVPDKMPEGKTGNIVCPVGTGGDFILLSHMDTARSTKGVQPIITDERITSDGTTVLGVDNRAGIACLLFAVETLIKNKIPLNDFTFTFTVQEETTLNGSMYLDLGRHIKMGFVFDSHLRPGNVVCESAGSKGFMVRIIGKAAHSGLAPEKGIDSVKIAAEAISKIQLGRIDNDTTANIGLIRGGSATNVIPELTTIEGEVRSMIPSKIDAKITEIEIAFKNAASLYGAVVEFNSFWNFKPYRIGSETEVYRKVENAITKTGLLPVRNISKGGSDANSLNAKEIACVNLGIGAENPHSNDEFILLEDLKKTSEIAMELMKK